MNRFTLTKFLLLGALAFSGATFADQKTVTLEVPGMTCSACPITVKKALTGVTGVEKVKVTFAPKEAVVTFDDKTASVEKLQNATKNAGFPSVVKVVATVTK